jgi:RNA polymerase subunit RPABC4/transcription elongation factor Spt4
MTEEGPLHCPHCGKEVMGEFDFCPYCGRGLKVMRTPQTEFHPVNGGKCPKCSSDIEADFLFCPYCGHKQGAPLKESASLRSGRMLLLYALSVLFPPAGVIAWMKWKNDPEGEARNAGEYCMGAAFMGLVLYVLILGIYF